jgi:hypothetical protein
MPARENDNIRLRDRSSKAGSWSPDLVEISPLRRPEFQGIGLVPV